MWPTIIVGTLTVLGSTLAALLTYKSTANKHRLDEYADLRAEVSRLRDALADRDQASNNSHNEILELRESIFKLNEDRFARELLISQLQTDMLKMASELHSLQQKMGE